MTSTGRSRRQQIIREAEGYLDLALLFGDAWAPSADSRERLARRSLNVLERLGEAAANGHVQYLRGQALRTLEQFEAALIPLQAAAELEPGDIHVWLTLGWCYKRTARLDRAIESLEQALEVEPSKAIIHYNLACYWSLAGNPRQALDYLSRAISMDSSFRDLLDKESDFDPIRSDPGFRALSSVIV